MDQAAPNCLKRSYSVQYLKSFAQSCRESPPNIDLQEVNTELADEVTYGEWRKHSPNSGKHTRHRRNRKKKLTGLQDSEKGSTTVTFPAWRAVGFDTVNQQDPKTTDKAFPLETSTVSKVEACNRTSIDKKKLSLTPLKLSETDIEESHLTCSKDADEASSTSDEFHTEQHFKHAVQTSDTGGDSSPGSTFSPERKIDIDSLFVKDKHRALPMPAARTVQDIEKDLLSDKETAEVEANTSQSPDSKTRVQWGDNNEDKAASERILFLLQQKNKGKKSGGESEKELLGELISSSPISNKLSNLDDVLKRYEQIAAADFQQAVCESKLGVENRSLNNAWKTSGMGSCSPTVVVDSVRTSVNTVQNQKVKSLPKPCSTSKNFQPHHNQQQQQQMWPRNSWAPNVFVRSGVAGVGAPLVPQALHALQRLVDHQLHILNSIPGEVTPGMLHERLSRSVLGYPPTGTHLLFTTHLR